LTDMSANATLAECCELIDEMRTIYSSSDDAVAVREARAAFGGLRAALDQRQGSLAASIRGACDPPSLASGHVLAGAADERDDDEAEPRPPVVG